MKNLENYGVQELNATELNEINGGVSVSLSLGQAINFTLGIVNIVVDAVQAAAVAVADFVSGFINGGVEVEV
ncbi:hypothetical protein [Sinomicrobium weinanense]|uniref:Class IIb bacteriocin, lactobin A/cerein 7B family n=1 Tax=Sinomicrobium weinanense TaxID=2842200 RepID=A0A926JND8_9FLAO|nr:hypothetical protein [Sinomicrobium weinanense]MBC9794401.1 hypothetical protein [Sinomicrobium weinanense]MBU3124308.1 hypothetical protein [Sinomicrobium weinanense]